MDEVAKRAIAILRLAGQRFSQMPCATGNPDLMNAFSVWKLDFWLKLHLQPRQSRNKPQFPPPAQPPRPALEAELRKT
jgi:hypothetical protein